MALLACYLVGALLVEFFVFMVARMGTPWHGAGRPGAGRRHQATAGTLSNPRSIAAPPLSLPAIAAVLASYLWVLVSWGCTCAARKRARAKEDQQSSRKPAKA